MATPPKPHHRLIVPGVSPAKKGPGGKPAASFLIGHGYDIHRLQKARDGEKLVLAGVAVSQDIAPIAHSDGDVIYHAIIDAILGGLGLGDIGESFSDTDPRWRMADSSAFLEDVVTRAKRAGYLISNVDVTLQLERPRIAPVKPEMIANLRRLLEPLSNVNIKAGTNEGCGAVGRGEAVAAHAVVLLAAQHAGTT